MVRELTTEEFELVQWLLAHGTDAASLYVSQLDRLTVHSVCECGCASINFAVDGVTPNKQFGMTVLADYEFDGDAGELNGIFAFSYGDLLAGIDVWSIAGSSDCKSLPKPSDLRPLVSN